MRKILLSVLLFAAVAVNAQVKYGLKAGVNLAKLDMKISGISVSTSSLTSFHLTGFADIGINEKFSFQPGLSFQGKGAKVDVSGLGSASQNTSYLEIPLNGVLHLPAGPGNVFLGAGPYAAFGLFGKSKMDGEADEDVSFGNGEDDDLSPLDFGLNFMAGYRLDNGVLFNVGYGLGLANIIPKDQRVDDAKGSNKVFSISIGYSF